MKREKNEKSVCGEWKSAHPGLKPNNELGHGNELGLVCILEGSPRGQRAVEERKLNHPTCPKRGKQCGKTILMEKVRN